MGGKRKKKRKKRKKKKIQWIYSVHGRQTHPIPCHELKPEPNAFTKLEISIRKKITLSFIFVKFNAGVGIGPIGNCAARALQRGTDTESSQSKGEFGAQALPC